MPVVDRRILRRWDLCSWRCSGQLWLSNPFLPSPLHPSSSCSPLFLVLCLFFLPLSLFLVPCLILLPSLFSFCFRLSPAHLLSSQFFARSLKFSPMQFFSIKKMHTYIYLLIHSSSGSFIARQPATCSAPMCYGIWSTYFRNTGKPSAKSWQRFLIFLLSISRSQSIYISYCLSFFQSPRIIVAVRGR